MVTLDELMALENPTLELAKAMGMINSLTERGLRRDQRERLLTSVVAATLDMLLRPDFELEESWPEFIRSVNRKIGMVPATAAVEPPGALVDDWLRSLDPNKLQAMWLSSGDFATGKGEAFLQKLRDMARADERLWPGEGT